MESQSVPEAGGVKGGGGLSFGEYGFLALMALVLVTITWIGVLSYQQGMHTENTKRNGEAWVTWLTANSAKRFEADYALAACAGGPAAAVASEPAAPKTWGTCLEAIQKTTELKDQVNPFTGKPPEFVETCDPADYTLHGDITIEKSVANPVGSAVPATASPLVASDAIDTKLQLKLSICDKGGYPVKVSEFEF